MAEIVQNRHQNIEHVELSIAAHRMRFSGIAAQMERTIAGVRHRNGGTGFKPVPHAAMLHTCDGVFQTPCDVSKSHMLR